MQKKPRNTIKESSRSVRTERVNMWPNYMTMMMIMMMMTTNVGNRIGSFTHKVYHVT
jgi:hypothetical protein